MNIRENLEELELKNLSPYAAYSKDSRGRKKEEEQCDIRPVYQRDRDRILHSNAFRRLKHKTQVFLQPEGDHYRTRLTHTLEVTRLARTAARALQLNEDLTEAIAFGHDLGHTPFGHAGERVLQKCYSSDFSHYKQSLPVVDKLEKMYALGIRTFAVFFDDIWGEGAKGDKQAGLLNYVTDEFVRKHTDVEPLIMCPTQYNKAWSGGDYLPTLGTKMYPEVRIMWTGNSVVDMIEKNDMEWINGQIRRKAFIWLNYPVNDYCQSRLLMGKTYGNGKDIYDMVSGFCSNPMEYAEASKVSLYSIADYTWNMPAYDAESSWKRSLRALMPTSPLAFAAFCQNNIDLGKTGHGLRREGESQLFAEKKVKPAFYFTTMTTAADALLADSVNQPEMLAEIGPWVESMRLLGQRGLQVLQMEHYLNQADSVAFIGAYRRLQAIEQAQKAIVSRNFEGSIVKAKPVVSGDVVTPWINTKANELVKAYRKQYAYGREFFPQQVIEDGQYFIKAGGKFLTDVQAATDRTGDHPVFVADRDNINPQRQQWFIELVPSTGRYKITNVQDGRYVNERGTFWKDKNLNPFEAEWHTFVIAKTQDGKFTVQCGGNAGKGYWNVKEDRIENQKEPAAFEIVPANK